MRLRRLMPALSAASRAARTNRKDHQLLTITDLFCGAGGSGLGASVVPGVSLRTAVNHWALAVESHAANFPDTDHDCADISQADPRRLL